MKGVCPYCSYTSEINFNLVWDDAEKGLGVDTVYEERDEVYRYKCSLCGEVYEFDVELTMKTKKRSYKENDYEPDLDEEDLDI